MNIIFTSNKETYKNIRRGTEILLSESDIFTENIELSVEFQDRPEIAVSKNENQIHVICREAAHYYRALNYVLHHMEDKTFQYQEHIYFERNGLMLDCSRNAASARPLRVGREKSEKTDNTRGGRCRDRGPCASVPLYRGRA